MATEKRLIYADDLKARFLVVAQSGGPVVVHVSDICKAIEDAAVYESVDAVEVVRCKDCIHYEYGKGYAPWCNHMCGLDEMGEDDFCSYGERKDNA